MRLGSSAGWPGRRVACHPASACVAFANPHSALFLVSAAALLLLFTGIHNAWDTIRYHVFMKTHSPHETENDRVIVEE
jgi:hypothetical protein